ncbi:MAG: excinuclease ABC subunit UvrC [Sphingopyxis sp.]
MSDPHAPDRFNEDRATYSLRGAELPDLEAGLAAIRNVLATLPLKPGVYRMHDARGEVLYVGKAKALKNRVANYTHVNSLPKRLLRMVAQTRSMTIVTTTTEAEALLFEAQLIKRYRPAYNVLLRDDKSFPFILLHADHAFPRLQKHRGVRRAKGQYYGPFASGGAVNQTLNALQKTFLLRSCTDNYFETRDRPCLLYQIKRCSAPCVGRIDADVYAELVADAKDFLGGKSSAVQAKIGAAMEAASAEQDYESAAVQRDRLRALGYIQGSQALKTETIGDADIFALAGGGGAMCIQAFFVRGGQNWGHRSFFPVHTAGVPEAEVLASFLAQFYEDVPPPKTILTDRKPAEAELLASALGTRAGKKISIDVPMRGGRAKMMDQARRNAREALERRAAEAATQSKLQQELAELFELPEPPQRVEIYDNSHIQGTNMVGAMVVAGPDGFMKGQYRKYNIKNPDIAPGDDFAMMREVFSRRFARAVDEDPDRSGGIWPDLVLIDGGKGQVSAAKAMLEEMGVEDVALIGVSKGPHHGREGREVFHFADGREVALPAGTQLLFYVQRLRDEAHRFAIGTHRQKRAKALMSSPLDEVPGIGPARKKALLMHFGTARAIRTASLEEIQRAPGISTATAQVVHDFYHG